MALYEGMFLLDNDTVRAGWDGAKAVVTDLITKHKGSVQTARRWDERPLAYPIKGKNRATYLLVHFEMDGDAIPGFHRDLEIKDDVLRYLQLRAESVPAEERELTEAEGGADFAVPEPPQDTPRQIAPELFMEREDRRDRPRRDDRDRDSESKDGEAKDGESKDDETKAEAKDGGDAKSEPKEGGDAAGTKTEAETVTAAATDEKKED